MIPRILIIDDEEAICSSLTFALEDRYEVYSTTDPKRGLKLILSKGVDLVLLDLRIDKVDGIDVLEDIKNIDSRIQVILMTAYGSIPTSVDAMKKGAFTFLTKPLDLQELMTSIESALARSGDKSSTDLHFTNSDTEPYYGIIGQTKSMKVIFNLIEKLKNVDTSVVIHGESGTGKELVARAIHNSGKRREHPFVAINCSAIPETLLEEELFGHKKGTFTGAVSDKVGKFEFASGGTIFLDEIGDMPIQLQSKLLRVLQQKEFYRLGENKPIPLKARFIAATNKDLKALTKQNLFREDLYYRLNVFEIVIPPLRERKPDIKLLLNHFIKDFNEKLLKEITSIDPETLDILENYDYPGNVRELVNILEHGVLLCEGGTLTTSDLPSIISNSNGCDDKQLNLDLGVSIGLDDLAGLTLQDAEKKLIEAALKINSGHRKSTANMLGISERGLRYKLSEYNIK